MLARRLPGLLPPLSFEESLETTAVWSVAGRLKPGQGLLQERPFRSPHHTISVPGLVGGGSPPRPGEISLAHHGVLFLDELPEFGRAALEALRQPLEDGEVTVVRTRASATLPSRFMLVAAMNPCPCGHAADPDPGRCRCTPLAREAYGRRVSGPILDRFDLHIEAPALTAQEITGEGLAESSAQVRTRVLAARERQQKRLARLPGVHANGQLRGRALGQLYRRSNASAVTNRRAPRPAQHQPPGRDHEQAVGEVQGGRRGDRRHREAVRKGSDHAARGGGGGTEGRLPPA